MTEYWGTCKVCGKEVDTDTTELSILPDYQKFLVKRNLFNRVWYHATDKEDWEDGIRKASTLIYYPMQKKYMERPDEHRMFVHLGSKETAARRSKDLNGLPFLYKVMLLPTANVSPTMFADNNRWPYWLGERVAGGQTFTEVNRYVNRYEVPGSVSLLAAYGSYRVVERVKNTK